MPKTKRKATSKEKSFSFNRKQIFLVVAVAILLSLSFAGLFAKKPFIQKENVLGTENDHFLQSKIYWEGFLQENPLYIDGWLELAIIYHEVGYVGGSQKALDAANNIDPNSQKVASTKKLLGL